MIALGIGGTWVSYLTALEPYRPIFVGITLVILFMAFRKIYILPRQCAQEDACAIPNYITKSKNYILDSHCTACCFTDFPLLRFSLF